MSLPMLDGNFNCLAPFMCEHKRNYVNRLVNFRNKSDKSFYITNWWTNGSDVMAYSRGNLGFVVINNSNNNLNQIFQSGLKAGQYCNLADFDSRSIKGNCDSKITVDQYGYARVLLNKLSALVIQ
jgi:alpha-amylase